MANESAKLNIGESYEVIWATGNENYGDLVLIRNNPSFGNIIFAKGGKNPTRYNCTLEGVVQPDLIDATKRFEGQLEQLFVSNVKVEKITDRYEAREIRAEIKFKQDRYKMSREVKA